MKLKNLVRGDTRLYHLAYRADITGATGVMTWRNNLLDADPGVLQIAGVLGEADEDGKITTMTFPLSKANSEGLSVQNYFVDFEVTRSVGTDVKTVKATITIEGGGG